MIIVIFAGKLCNSIITELKLYLDKHISPFTNIAPPRDLKFAVGHIMILIKVRSKPY